MPVPPQRRFAAALFLAIAATFLLAPVTGGVQTGRLAGQVVDQDGEPVAGITVRVRNDERAVDLELVTDDNGRFSRTGLEPGVSYRLTVDAEGYLPLDQSIQVGERGSDLRVTLRGGRAYAESRYQQGYEAYERRDFAATAEAMADATAALRDTEEPGELYADALVLLGFSRSQLGDLDAAADAYQALVDAAPEDSRGHFGLGGIHANRGETEAAIEDFQRAVELAPDDSRARFALGAMYVEAKRWEDAIPVLEAAVQSGGTPALVHLWLGNAHAATGNAEAAIGAFETYLELAPDAPEREQVEATLEKLRQGGDDGEGPDGR